MSEQTNLGGTFTFPNTLLTLNRMGYGAMQLAGKGVLARRVMWMLLLLFCAKPSH